MVRHLHGSIAERARTQLGLVNRDQLLRLGASSEQLEHLVARGILERVEPRVLRVGGAPTSWEQMLLAGILGLGPRAVVSHMSAAALWELEGVRPTAVELTVPRSNRNRIAIGRVHSTLHLEPIDVARRNRFPVTAAARTIIDTASRFSLRQLEGIVDAACRDHLVTEELLLERLGALRRPGRSKLLAVLGADAATGRPHTWLERELVQLCRQRGIEGLEVQVELTHDGKVARVDGLIAAAKLVIEVAGHRTHSTRRQRQADHERRLRLEQRGFRVLEFTYEDVTQRPDYVGDTIVARFAVTH